MIRKAIVAMLIIAFTQAACTDGCLKCDTEKNRCMLCDITDGFKIQNGGCIFKETQNCSINNLVGQCLVCKEKHFLDLSSLKCVELVEELMIDNCDSYGHRGVCVFCKKGFFLKSQVCLAVETPITNCLYHNSQGLCLVCDQGSVLSLDQLRCSEKQSVANCATYSFTDCYTCNGGYTKNRNNYLYEQYGFLNSEQYKKLYTKVAQEKQGFLDGLKFPMCQMNMVSNCLEFQTFDTCKQCQSNYFLTLDGQCQKYPEEQIDHCERYQDLQNCIRCKPNYFLKTSNECLPIETITQCKAYSQTESVTLCLECQPQQYLVERNVCIDRTSVSQIPNCKALEFKVEKCAVCNTGFQLTTDNLKCLHSINKCSEYAQSSSQTIDLVCLKCDKEYYYATELMKCEQGTIEHCEDYSQNDNVCHRCKNRYFLNDQSECQSHFDIDFCLTYSFTAENACNDCQHQTFNFSITNTCQPVHIIPHCAIYSGVTSCQTCEDGFYVDDLLRCQLINPTDNCLQKNGSGCIKCLSYYILESGQCELPLEYQLIGCGQHNLDGQIGYSEFKCDYCRENFLPINYINSFVCVQDEYLDFLGTAQVPDCVQYYENGIGQYKCSKCKRGFVLKADETCDQPQSCQSRFSHRIAMVDQSGDGTNDSAIITHIDQCTADQACRILSPDLYQNDINNVNYSCSECTDTFIQQVDFTNEKVLLKRPPHPELRQHISPVSFQPPVTCVSSTSPVVGDNELGQGVEHCEYYQNHNQFLGCLKCEHGFSGQVVDKIFQCRLYDSETTCGLCREGFFLQSPYNCQKINPLPHCEEYDNAASDSRCTRCEERFFTDTGLCVQRANPNNPLCVQYAVNADDCGQCHADTQLLAGDCFLKQPHCEAMSDPATCSACNPGYYLYTNTCIEGTITNCVQYTPNVENQCAVCDHQHYLLNNACLLSSAIIQCEAYSKTNPNSCVRCNPTFMLWRTQFTCEAGAITECVSYVNKYQCQQCSAGFFVSNFGIRCMAIPVAWNCVTFEGSTMLCTQCSNDYSLLNGKCLPNPLQLLDNCKGDDYQVNAGLAAYSHCKYCDPAGDSATYTMQSFDLPTPFRFCMQDEYVTELRITMATFPDNCLAYTEVDATSYTCARCADGFFLTSANECVDTCPEQAVMSYYVGKIPEGGTTYDLVQGVNGPTCALTSAITFTTIGSCIKTPQILVDALEPLTYYCAICLLGVKLVDLTSNNVVSQIDWAETSSPVTMHPSYDCYDFLVSDTIIGEANLAREVTNCEYYYFSTTYICLKCIDGFVGVIDVTNTIQECVTNAEITSGGTLAGLYTHHDDYQQFRMLYYFGKVACTSGIPVMVLDIAGTGYFGYDKATPTAAFDVDTVFGNNLVCSGSLSDGLALVTTAVANCALAVMTDVTATALDVVDSALGTAFCVACEPAYYPTYPTDILLNYKKLACTTISDCLSSTWYNTCEVCNTGFAWDYVTLTSRIDYGACVAAVDYCEVMSGTSCLICKKGYLLDQAVNQCFLETPSYCSSNVVSYINKSFGAYAFHYTKNGAGCTACDSGYSPMQFLVPIQSKVCLMRPIQVVADPAIADCQASQFIYNLIENRYDCTLCETTHIPALDGGCASKVNHQFCVTAKAVDDTVCMVCDLTYSSVAGVCKVFSDVVANCDTFADSSNSEFIICQRCTNGFYRIQPEALANHECVSYASNFSTYTNCAQFDATNPYENDPLCIECMPTYGLVITEGNVRRCVPNVPSTCSFSIADQLIGELNCETCNTVSELVVQNPMQNTCLQIELIADCAVYNLSPPDMAERQKYLLTGITLLCLECDPTHFLTVDGCTIRDPYPIPNCQTHASGSNSCEVCNENFFLNAGACVDQSGVSVTPAPKAGHILNCTPYSKCNKEKFFHGISSHISSVLSCHECLSATEIPFAFIRGGAPYSGITGINEYNNILDTQLVYDQERGGLSTQCLEPVMANFSISDSLLFNFPTNCAVGINNVNSPPDATDSSTDTSVDLTKISVFCGACKPGYSPSYSTYLENALQVPVPLMIHTCTAIANCEFSIWFNNCTQCEDGYAHRYRTATGVQYDTCMSYDNHDCLAVDDSAPSNPKCVFCKHGTYLNKDGFCERIQPPRCEHKEFTFENQFFFNDLSTGLFLNREGTGCQRCDDGFTAFKKTTNHYVCTESVQHARAQVPDGTNYIAHCKNYKIDLNDNILKCVTCDDDFIPLSSGGECTSLSALPNCKIAQNSEFCSVCEDQFILVNRVCAPKDIENCIEYQYDENSSIPLCKDCGPGYYREANRCHLGEVMNCYLFETRHRCNKCLPGFALVFQNNGYNYCYPINETLKCAQFNEDKFQGGELQCTQCVNPHYVIVAESFYKSICMKYFEIANCHRYDIHPAIADSSFECLECQPNFFLTNKECNIRLLQNDQCLLYSLTDDLCDQCVEGFYLSSDRKLCLPNPTGIKGCRVYSSLVDCSACDTNKFLENNTCVDIVEENRIQNCVFYLNRPNCEVCENGFIVVNGICEQTQVENCGVFISSLLCEQCLPGYGFQEVDGTTSCVQKNVDSCAVSEDLHPFNCIICLNGYYVGETGCLPVPTLILNCVEYSGIESCSKCKKGSALSLDKKLCLSTIQAKKSIDSNCLDTQVLENPICNTCKPGYYFVNGECIECGDPNSRSSGCFNCHPENPTVCLMCKPGYFQNKDGDCLEFGSTQEDVPANNERL